MNYRQKGMRRRFWQIILMFASFGWDFRRLKKKKWASPEAREHAYREVYRKQATKFRETAVEMGGLLIKLGQFFSSRVDILPQEYTDELSLLQDQVPPADTSLVKKRLTEELQQDLGQVFAYLSEQPLAAASLGQVHEGRLLSGERVAVKVLRPGIEEIIAVDLRAIRVVIKGIERYTDWLRNVDIDAIYAEFKETMEEELDYLLEGQHADRFRENFVDFDLVKVPKVYWDYTTKRVIVLEFIEGTKVTDYPAVEALGWERADLAQLLVDTYLKQVLEDGFFHADPHPGNLMVTDRGQLVYLDFGMMGEVSEELKSAVKDAAIAIATQNSANLVEAFDRIGFIRPHADRDALTRVVEMMVERYQKRGTGLVSDVNNIAEDLRELFYSEPFQLPAKVTFLGRALVTVVGITGGLNPSIDYLESIKPYIDNLYPKNTGFQLLLEQGKNLVLQYGALPGKVERIAKRLEAGKLRVRTSQEELIATYQHQAKLANRVVWAILAMGTVFTAAILLVGGFWGLAQITGLIACVMFIGLIQNLWFGRTRDKYEQFRQRHQKQLKNRPVGFKTPH